MSYSQSSNFAFAVQANIQHGIIEGNYDTKTGIQTYFGVPFAKPPVGELRWKEPQPLAPWQGVKQTKQRHDTKLTHKEGSGKQRNDATYR